MNFNDNFSNYRILFYTLTKEQLEELCATFVVEENYSAQKVALDILIEHKKKIINLPIPNAAEIITAESNTLLEILNNSVGVDANTLSLARLELNRRGKLKNSEKPTSSNVSSSSNGCLGLSLFTIVILIVFIVVLLMGLSALVHGFFGLGSEVIKGVLN